MIATIFRYVIVGRIDGTVRPKTVQAPTALAKRSKRTSTAIKPMRLKNWKVKISAIHRTPFVHSVSYQSCCRSKGHR